MLYDGFERPPTNDQRPSANTFFESAPKGAGNRVDYNYKYEYTPPDPKTRRLQLASSRTLCSHARMVHLTERICSERAHGPSSLLMAPGTNFLRKSNLRPRRPTSTARSTLDGIEYADVFVFPSIAMDLIPHRFHTHIVLLICICLALLPHCLPTRARPNRPTRKPAMIRTPRPTFTPTPGQPQAAVVAEPAAAARPAPSSPPRRRRTCRARKQSTGPPAPKPSSIRRWSTPDPDRAWTMKW